MTQAAHYSAAESLRDGRKIEIRSLRPDDHENFLAAAKDLTAQSLRQRFFAFKREFTEAEQSFFTNVDFVNHVALIAIVIEGGQPVIAGGGRYIIAGPGQAEIAVTVADKHQGQGIGSALLHHLIILARAAGLRELVAQVLPENLAMLNVLKRSGLPQQANYEAGMISLVLQLDHIE
jgi:RimJ/RimL family protein N-acetyltransferase